MQQQYFSIPTIQINVVELQLLTHYLMGEEIPSNYLSEEGRRVLELLDNYTLQYQQRPPLEYLSTIVQQGIGQLHSVEFLTEALVQSYTKRELKYACEQATNAIDTNPAIALQFLEDSIQKLNTVKFTEAQREAVVFLSEYKTRIEALLACDPDNPDANNGVFKTICGIGFPSVDNEIQGLCEGDVLLIIGQTNEGKSMIAKRIAQHVAINETQRVLYLTYEEQTDVAIHMVDAMYAGVDSRQYMKRTLDAKGRLKLQEAFEKYEQMPTKGEIILPDVSSIRKGSIIDLANLIQHYNTKVIVVDQLTFVAKSLGWEDLSDYIRDLKTLARKMGIAVIGLSQAKKDAKPVWDVGYEAAAHAEELVRTSDSALYVAPNKDSVEVGVKLLKLIKNRRGAKDLIIKLRWDLDVMNILDMGVWEGPFPTKNKTKFTKKPNEAESNPAVPPIKSRNVFDWSAT